MLLLCFCPCITLPLLLLPLPKKPVSAMMGEREEDAREEEAELCTPMNSSDHWDRWMGSYDESNYRETYQVGNELVQF